MDPALPDPAARLALVPWRALAGLGREVSEALGPVLQGAAAERALDRFLRARRALTREQRAAAAEAIFGVALWRRRLAAQAGLPSHEGAAPALLLAALLRDLGGLPEGEACALAGAAPAPGRGAPRGWPELLSFPDALARELEEALGGEAEAFARAVSLPGPVFLRTNTVRGTREALQAALFADGIESRPCAFAPGGLEVTTPRPNLLAARALREGLCEAQDEGSQLLGALVGARPGEPVLDACAGSGGKSLQLASAVGPAGRVACHDVDEAALSRLRTRARRAGAGAVEVVASLEGPADQARALVDAPCSELGPLRRGPDARWRLQPGAWSGLPALQLELLARAAARVRPGGRLVYATCTVRRAENEEVALAFERASPAFARARPGDGWLDARFVEEAPSGPFFRALPHRHGTDGFFAAVWERR